MQSKILFALIGSSVALLLAVNADAQELPKTNTSEETLGIAPSIGGNAAEKAAVYTALPMPAPSWRQSQPPIQIAIEADEAEAMVGITAASPESAAAVIPPASTPVDPGRFGRHGPLTEQEMAMAKAAWQFFVVGYQPATGLVNSVGSYPSTTLWDTASYISGLVSAYELGVIDKRTFDERAYKLIGTLRNLDLFQGEFPNKVYNTETAAKVDYTNKPGEIGFSALDGGRLMVWLRILKERYPYLANGIDNTLLRWNFCNAVDDQGRLFGAHLNEQNEPFYAQEGRLGYGEYAAKGFALWGFDTQASYNGAPFEYTDIYGVDVPYDRRDPRVFKSSNYVVTEGYVLDGLEMGWDLPGDRTSAPGVATQGWRAEFATRVYYAQQRRYEETGIMTVRSEHQVDGAPYFVYDTVFANGYAWNTIAPSGDYSPDRAAVATKAGIGMWALWETPYTDLVFEMLADLYDPEKGFNEGIYENGSGSINLQSANNNGIILASLLYKVQGPILRYSELRNTVWDTAFRDMDVRAIRCLPDPASKPKPCDCEEPPVPLLKEEDFLFCQPNRQNGVTTAQLCRLPDITPEVHSIEQLEAGMCEIDEPWKQWELEL